MKNHSIVALAMVGLEACRKNDFNTPGKLSTSEDTKISISLSIASSSTKTYTPGGDPTATVDELDMNTVDIFIYENVSPFALTHKHFEDTDNASVDFELGYSGERRLKNGMELDAKTGEKLIYVGVNLPSSYVSQIKATQSLASLEGVFSTWYLYNGLFDDLLPSGMAMFSNQGAVAILGKTELGVVPATNQVSLTLTRMLAKVTVDGTDAFKVKIEDVKRANNLMPVVDGSIDVSTLKYSLTQTNNNTYLKGNQVIPWIEDTDFFTRAFATELGSVPKYTPENRAENDFAKLTYAVVEARFIPEVFEDAGTYVPGNIFFTVTDPSNGSVRYYINANRAMEAADNKEFRIYKNGRCYYPIYLNPENDHKVVRNEYYQVKISTIRGIGKTHPAAALVWEGSLRNPELLNFDGVPVNHYVPEPAATYANIEATVMIVPWEW